MYSQTLTTLSHTWTDQYPLRFLFLFNISFLRLQNNKHIFVLRGSLSSKIHWPLLCSSLRQLTLNPSWKFWCSTNILTHLSFTGLYRNHIIPSFLQSTLHQPLKLHHSSAFSKYLALQFRPFFTWSPSLYTVSLWKQQVIFTRMYCAWWCLDFHAAR